MAESDETLTLPETRGSIAVVRVAGRLLAVRVEGRDAGGTLHVYGIDAAIAVAEHLIEKVLVAVDASEWMSAGELPHDLRLADYDDADIRRISQLGYVHRLWVRRGATPAPAKQLDNAQHRLISAERRLEQARIEVDAARASIARLTTTQQEQTP